MYSIVTVYTAEAQHVCCRSQWQKNIHYQPFCEPSERSGINLKNQLLSKQHIYTNSLLSMRCRTVTNVSDVTWTAWHPGSRSWGDPGCLSSSPGRAPGHHPPPQEECAPPRAHCPTLQRLAATDTEDGIRYQSVINAALTAIISTYAKMRQRALTARCWRGLVSDYSLLYL